MALKKYKIAVGNCGPTIMFTNIIKASDEKEAVTKFLEESDKEISEENMKLYLPHVIEVRPMEAPEKIRDFEGKEIKLDDKVVFIRNTKNQSPKVLAGRVVEIKSKGILVEDESGETTKLMLSKVNPESLMRVVVMKERPERDESDLRDATGFPILEGDTVYFMGDISMYRCDSFKKGTVDKYNGKTVVMTNGSRKTPDKIVVTGE